MINVSSAWHRALFNDNRNYIEQIKLTLQDNTVINLTNENIWGGAKFDDAVSGDSDFQIGAAIVNKLIFNINNIYDDFSEYDFGNAKVEAKIGLVTDEGTEIIKKGTYTVNSASYNGSLINLECYDYMAKFEKPYSDSTLVYPATLDTIVRGACTDCGVVLQTLDFPHKTFVIQERPDDDNCSYREIIAWCAQIAGCFARCNVDGKLELKWYDQDAINNVVGDLDGGIFDNGTPSYTSGDTADGGTFNPWNTGYVHDSGSFTDSIRAHHIDSLYSHDISVDDVIITGIRILVNSTGTNPIEPVLVGTLGYVIEISNNPLITTTNASQIATWLGTQLIGFTFRKAQISHGSDPSIEAGDVAFVIDGKARTYPIVISHTVFAVGSAQSTTSSAQTPARNSAQRYGTETKNYVELRKAIKSEKTAREQAEDDLADAIANANGLYETTIENELTHAVTYYLHNKEHLSDSAIRIMFSDVGITVTADGGQHWYGLTASGDMITHLLSATGINADWINTGQLVIEDAQHNETFFADADSGVVRIAPTQFTLTPANQQYIQNTANSAASGAEETAKSYTDTKISTYDTNLNQQAVFDKLTNNGQTQGIFLDNNKVYINMSYATTGTLVVGGSGSNTDGVIEIKNSSGTRIGRIDKTGMFFGGSEISTARFSVNSNGSVYIRSDFGSTSRYAMISPTNGFMVQGNGINAKLYASDWTYKQNDTVDPGAEVPDYSASIDIDTRPGFYGYNTAFKVTDSSYSSRGTYTAIGKNYIEIAYSSKDWDVSDSSSYPTIAQLRSTSSHQTLMLAYRYGDLGTEKSLILDETGFRKIVNNGSTFEPYTGNLVVGSKTYHVRGGIICT